MNRIITRGEKEGLVAAVLVQRGRQPGLVYVLYLMEGCSTNKLWVDKASGTTGLKTSPDKCLH